MRHHFVFVVFLTLVPIWHATGDERVDRLSEERRRWLEEEVVYIISDIERETFLSLETDEEFDAFIDAFWRKRDSNPTTLENEFQLEHYERLAYVNKFFGRDTFREGWQTDQGKYYIMLGPPTEQQNYEGYDKIYPAKLWFYNDPELKRYNLPPFFYLLFFRRGGFGELELYNPMLDEPQDLLTGYQSRANFFRDDVERAYTEIYENISPELAHATLSFRTDDIDLAQFQAPAFGTISLLNEIENAPLRGVDTSYAEHFDAERGMVESDYLFTYVQSQGMVNVLSGPGRAHYIHWTIEVEPQNVVLVQDPDRGVYASVFILSMEVVPKGNPNLRVIDARKESFMNFPEGRAQSVLTLPFRHSGMVPIVPGEYDVRVIWRNRACSGRDESTCRKSYTLVEGAVEVPEWTEDRPRLTAVVLGYGTERDGEEPAYAPYRFGNLEFLPNPGRVYSLGDSVVALVDGPQLGGGGDVRFRLDREDLDQTVIEASATASVSGLGLEPIVHEIPLEGLEAGRYRLVVELLDEGGAVLQSRSEPFVITPRTATLRPGVRGSWSEISPDVPGLLEMALGQQYVNLEEYDRARALLEASVAKNPRVPPSREALTALLLKEGEAEKAVELLAPIRQYMPDRYEMLVLLGEARFLQENYQECRDVLAKAASTRRLEPRLVRMLALSHAELGETDRAIAAVESALSRTPGHPLLEPLLEELQTRSN